jgi:uncharacterized SAM-binding protein YcdF (DUF218 family)
MSAFITGLLHPFVFLSLIFVFLFAFRKRWKTPNWIWGLYFFMVYLHTTPFWPDYLLRRLEQQHPTPSTALLDSLSRVPVHIVSLGAGKNDEDHLPPNQRLENAALARLVEALRLQRRLPHAQLVLSGPYGLRGKVSQAAIKREMALDFGVTAEQIHLMEQVVNTRDEAALYRSMMGADTPVLVCSSASHLPRALFWFRYFGAKEVYGAPAEYLAPPSKAYRWRSFFPAAKPLSLAHVAYKEILAGFLQRIYPYI